MSEAMAVLRKEHDAILKMLGATEEAARRLEAGTPVRAETLEGLLEFLRLFADKCHHGKEEDILFKSLDRKQIPRELKATMDELKEEHLYARKLVGRLADAKDRCVRGETDALRDISECMGKLVEFYPAHIAKEDKRFFLPCMEQFTRQEQAEMLQEFWDFDRFLFHEKYRKTAEQMRLCRTSGICVLPSACLL